MLKRKPKVLTPEQVEEIRTKDFFDMILPGTIRFLSDHYIVGDSYRCVWAVREYPPSTEEQAILSQLADRSGVTLRIYHRLVESMEQRKIIQNATRRNRLKSGGNDVNETIEAEGNLQDVIDLLANLRKNKEPLLHVSVFIELKARSMEKLKELQSDIAMELTRSKISVDRLTLRQKEGFLSVIPTGCNQFGAQYERVLPASSVANMYPFNFSGKTDPQGAYIGRDKYGTNILVDFDRRAEDKTTSNILILGNSGQGKSYLLKLILTNIRESGKRIICLDPESEYEDLCEALGGCYIDFMSGEYTINPLEPKAWTDSVEDIDATATERILNRIEIANNYKKFGSIAGGGYIWHTTGSGKTLTSFKTARLASALPYIDKVLFVVDRKDLDYQTMKEYDRFEKGAANSNTSTAILKKQLEDENCHIIITTIQKLATFIKKNPGHAVYQKHVVIIFDECHRSQFGDMHTAIVKNFRKYHLFGFTGTPIFSVNAQKANTSQFFTTEQTFGDQLHTYTIVDAINDHNVLPFRVDYVKTMDVDEQMVDEDVYDIDRERAYMAPKRIELVTKYILDHFDQKTYRGDKTYIYNTLTNISEVASAARGAVEEIKQKQRLSGFNSMLAVASVPMARLYYNEFKRQMSADPTKKLRIATIFSYTTNEADPDSDLLDEENPEDTSALDASSRDFLDSAIRDYNEMFRTNYSTDGDGFQSYYKDVSLRMKNKELDLLIVVNMFLTGFDATTLNTLWVDKNLRMHGLIQAFSRTNRILNSIKTFGNIVCFRNLQKRVDSAISLFGDKNAGGIVLMRKFDDYYHGYIDAAHQSHPGYVDMIAELETDFPLSEPRVEGELNQKHFIALFGAILRMRNLLSSFDEFAGKDLLSERDLQDYLGRYQDLRDEWRERRRDGQKEDITDDVVFEVELIRQIEINIDYILLLVKKYHDTHGTDKEILITIQKAVDASPELRSKKALIETFISGINDVEDVLTEWHGYVAQEKEKELSAIIADEKLNESETRKFIDNAFRDGEIKTTGTDIDKLMPPTSRFGGGNRAEKKRGIIEKLKGFFERFFGI